MGVRCVRFRLFYWTLLSNKKWRDVMWVGITRIKEELDNGAGGDCGGAEPDYSVVLEDHCSKRDAGNIPGSEGLLDQPRRPIFYLRLFKKSILR